MKDLRSIKVESCYYPLNCTDYLDLIISINGIIYYGLMTKVKEVKHD